MTPHNAIAETIVDEAVAPEARPAHIAIIMDGNGRWARAHGLPRTEGHRKGVEAVRRTVDVLAALDIEVLTLFSFSSENWRRPESEITFLFELLKRYIREDLDRLHAKGVRIRVIGEKQDIDPDLAELVAHAESLTCGNSRFDLQVAFNYGGQNEIARAVRAIAHGVKAGTIDPDQITTETVAAHLDTAGLPEPDLLIRTSGEQRLSNFLLWQCAYTEFVFLPVLWPDFSRSDIEEALSIYAGRKRRFGGLQA